MSTFEAQAGIGRGSAVALHAASSAAASERAAIGRGAALAWRALVAAALLSLVLGGALYESFSGGRSSASVHVRPHGGFSQTGLLSLPLAAQGAVSATLGADSAAYRVGASADGFAASSPTQHLSASFGTGGVSVRSGATRVGLSLRGVGYGSSLRAIASVKPLAQGNRVVYPHRGLSEWYANGPLGLEQGFTIASAPAGHAAGPLTLSIALSGNAHAALGKGAQSITLTRAGKSTLRYPGLSATDARGHALHSWLALRGGRLLLRVDASGARYPLRIDPFIQQGGKLTGEGESGKGDFGYSVALSANGDTALIGAPYDNSTTGAAWVFTRTGKTWTQQGGKLTGAGESGEGEFGWSVALSAEGNTALIGARRDHAYTGAAWVFTRTGSTWTQQGEKLTGGEESGEGTFGTGVALSSSGNTALIGGAFDNTRIGAAWVFTRSGSKWTQQGKKLTGTGESGKGQFGYSVALSSEGNTALIGGIDDNGNVGAVWVFTLTGKTWAQQGEKLTGTGQIGEGYFGASVALSSEGDTALIGGPYDDAQLGAAWAFTRTGEKWSQQNEKLTGAGESGDGYFGYSVALSSEGATALVGGLADASSLGAAWAFEYQPGATVETGSASEVTPESATLNATVNPNSVTVSECKFEYGTTESYGKAMACSPSPGSGKSPVAVTASLSSLSADTTYHFRIAATNEHGTSYGSDETFTTLLTSASGSTSEEKKPAEATDGELFAKASSGTGTITVGPYGSDIGGSQLSHSTDKYLDVYHSTSSDFTQIEVKDCELGGGKSIWWDNPAASWEPISGATAVYSEAGPCITVTITKNTKPDLAQMTGTRFGTRFGEAPGPLQSGKCEAAKDSLFTEGACLTVAEKSGKPDGKGKYEWYPSPVECFPEKNGYYSEKCLTQEVKKGKPKGKAEKGSGAFKAAGGVLKYEITGLGTLECKTSTSVGAMTGEKTGTQTITYQGCKLASSECASKGETPGAIRTSPLETFVEEEGKGAEIDIEVFENPIMTFSCAGEEYTLAGGFRGEIGATGKDAPAGINSMSKTSKAVFNPGVGEQELVTTADEKDKEYKTTLTTEEEVDAEQPTEINTAR
jgi:hypothetical protein